MNPAAQTDSLMVLVLIALCANLAAADPAAAPRADVQGVPGESSDCAAGAPSPRPMELRAPTRSSTPCGADIVPGRPPRPGRGMLG